MTKRADCHATLYTCVLAEMV